MRHHFTAKWIHDRVVNAIAAQARGYMVCTNLGGRSGVYVMVGHEEISPDIMLCDPESFAVRYVMEVETEDTVTPERTQHWRQITHAHRDFWLLVPPSMLSKARHLCSLYGVPARVGTWSFQTDAGVAVHWHEREVAGRVRRTPW